MYYFQACGRMFEPVSGKIKIVGVPNGGAFLAVGVGRYCAARERSFWFQCLVFPRAAVSFRSRVRRLTNDARSHAHDLLAIGCIEGTPGCG